MSLTADVRNEVTGAIEEAYRRYGDEVLAYANRYAKPVAYDIEQYVFLHLTMHGDEVRGNIRSWLLAVAKDAVATWKRARCADLLCG